MQARGVRGGQERFTIGLSNCEPTGLCSNLSFSVDCGKPPSPKQRGGGSDFGFWDPPQRSGRV